MRITATAFCCADSRSFERLRTIGTVFRQPGQKPIEKIKLKLYPFAEIYSFSPSRNLGIKMINEREDQYIFTSHGGGQNTMLAVVCPIHLLSFDHCFQKQLNIFGFSNGF